MAQVDLAEVLRELSEWSKKPESIRGTELALHLLGTRMPAILNELREARILLERTQPKIGW